MVTAPLRLLIQGIQIYYKLSLFFKNILIILDILIQEADLFPGPE
jgi:hypothetical protein